jgi:hypothetical protein
MKSIIGSILWPVGRCKCPLTDTTAALILQSVLGWGGNPSAFRVLSLGDRVFISLLIPKRLVSYLHVVVL